MKKYFEQLRPMERRLAVGVIVAVLLVFNYVVIWPHFNDWGNLNSQIQTAQRNLQNYKNTIAQAPLYTKKLQEFSSQGEYVAPADQAINMMQSIQSQSIATGVSIVNASRSVTHTNDAFFVEQIQNISVVATDAQLVNFLYQLGNDASMIRVRQLDLSPDNPRQHLNASLQLVASYQKTPSKPGKPLKTATASAK
jgi:type II secretory pathway component PulM